MRICNFDGARPLGAPKDWDQHLDGACGVLPVLDAVDEQSGFNFMYSVWRLTPEELAVIQAGGAIRLGISGRVHPVINMAVLSPEICADAHMQELPE